MEFDDDKLWNAWVAEHTRRKALPLCNDDCNNCPLVNHDNSRMLTKIFNLLYEKFGDEAYKVVQGLCPNLTVCFDCRIDDFCHLEGCTLVTPDEERKRNWTMTENKKESVILPSVLRASTKAFHETSEIIAQGFTKIAAKSKELGMLCAQVAYLINEAKELGRFVDANGDYDESYLDILVGSLQELSNLLDKDMIKSIETFFSETYDEKHED